MLTNAKKTVVLAFLGLASCVSPHGMQSVGGPDDAGYTYHMAQGCVDSWCGTGLASAALYGPVRPDGTRDIKPLGSAAVTSTGTNVGFIAGLIVAGTADGLSHRTW
jgi:hypothetical protein